MTKVALITAGGSGMGADAARRLHADGFHIGILSASGKGEALAQELASRNITVNCVAPGFIHSAMTDVLPDAQKQALTARIPAGDLGTGEDIAAAVVYLASREAGYVTGQTIHVNGGMAMV